MNVKFSVTLPGGNRKIISYISQFILILIFIVYANYSEAQQDLPPKSFEIPSLANKDAPAFEKSPGERYSLSEAIEYALKNNPAVRISEKDIEAEAYGIEAAQAERMPRIDFGSSALRYRYPTPVITPVISGLFGPNPDFPEYSRNIYDAGGSFKLPIFKGGRLYRAVQIA